MIYEFNHFGIEVEDLEASLAFYRDTLGGRIALETRIDSVPLEVVLIEIAGGLIELLHHPAGSARGDLQYGFNHVAFLSDDVEADFERLIDGGYEALMPPRDLGGGEMNAFIRGANGTRVELLRRPKDLRGGTRPEELFDAIDHVSIESESIPDAVRFYRDFIGMSEIAESGTLETGTAPKFLGFDADVIELCAPGPRNADTFPYFALRVAVLDEVVATLSERGVHPVIEPAVAPSGRGRVAVYEDPTGVRFGVFDRVLSKEQ